MLNQDRDGKINETQAGGSTGGSANAGLHVLAVEDNPDLLELLCEMLDVLGHSVRGVSSAEEALTVIENEGFDALLADINLPGMSGVALAERISRCHPGLKIILASGYSKSMAPYIESRSTLLPKPYTFDQLQQALEKNPYPG